MKKIWNKFVTWAVESWWAWGNGIHFRTDIYEERMDYCAFWEEINSGWYQMYIYPYDDWYHPYLSNERKLRIGK